MIFLHPPKLTRNLSERTGRADEAISLEPQYGQQEKPEKVEEVKVALEAV
jgi:hypothetical protein